MEIVAGLFGNNAEIVGFGGKNHTIVNGGRIPLEQSPKHILEAIDNTMDATDHKCLDEMGIYGQDSRRNQWVSCNLSKYDHIPDYVFGQKTVNRESVECCKRGSCRFETKLCRTQSQLTGLTPRELEYLNYTVIGLFDKEIARIMGTSLETTRSHSKNIRIKKGLARKADLVRYAQKLNLNFQSND